MGSKRFACLAVLAFLLSCGESRDPLMYVAHAGGGFEGKIYNNNIESVQNSYMNGFRLIEIDFLVTRDGGVVCGYTWEKEGWVRPPVQKDFESRVKEKKCTVDSLVDWLKNNEDARVVVDVKKRPVFVWAYMANNFPDLLRRFIPQAYRISDVVMLKEMGYHDVFLTLYKYKKKEIPSVLKSLQSCDGKIGAIVLDFESDALTLALSRKFRKCDIKILVYTVNDSKVVDRLIKESEIDGVYTDSLLPNLL